jgi:hypothetical protein
MMGLLLAGCSREGIPSGGSAPTPASPASGDNGGTGGVGSGGGDPSGGGTPFSFAVFGDARPPIPEDSFQYPSAIVSGIFSQAQAQGAQIMIGTGDYMNAFTSTAVDAQVQAFQSAQSGFKGSIYLAMGNHECQTTTQSNCPNGSESPNVQAYLAKLAPAGVNKPYYRIDLSSPSGTAKIIFIAPNAWSTEQEDWLKQQIADATKYTFIVRHEPSDSNTAPGVTPSDMVLAGAPLTVAFYGHTHEYKRLDVQHVISGNGGAPLDTGTHYGFVLVQQLADGNLALSEIDQATGMPLDAWKVTPDGQPAP